MGPLCTTEWKIYIDRSSVGRLENEIETQEELNLCKKADARVIVDLWRETHNPASGALLLPYPESFWLEGGDYSRRYAMNNKGIADSTINSAIKAVFVPINDFWMQAGVPEKSPARLVSYVSVEEYYRDILSIAEAAKVFRLESLSKRLK